MRSASDIVEDALRLLEKHGWATGASVDADGRICCGEALVRAAAGASTSAVWSVRLADHWAVVDRAAWAILAEVGYVRSAGNGLTTIAGWNDSSVWLTFGAVRAAMERAAKVLRNEGE